MLIPKHLQKYEGLLILCFVIVGLLSILLASFVFAYVFKWERLMTQIRIQKDNAAKKKVHSNGTKNGVPKHVEAIPLSN